MSRINNLRIGFVSSFNPKDRKSASGTPFKLFESIQQLEGVTAFWIPYKKCLWLNYVQKAFNLIGRPLTGKSIDIRFTFFGAWFISHSVPKHLFDQADILFWCFGSQAMYHVKTSKPVIYITDAVFSSMVGYYLKNLSPANIRQGNKIEQKALDKAACIIVSSDWAKNACIQDYSIAANKLKVFQYGANIDEKDIHYHIRYKTDHLNLLFLGVNWIRKGGDIAVKICQRLNETGVKTTLYILGIKELADEIKTLPNIEYVGFLNKNNPEEYRQLIRYIDQAHCLLLPTKAECTAIVFNEAAANGLPVFTYATGGTPSVVVNGINGYALPMTATVEDFALKIKEVWETNEIETLSRQCKEQYENHLSWKSWSRNFENILYELNIHENKN